MVYAEQESAGIVPDEKSAKDLHRKDSSVINIGKLSNLRTTTEQIAKCEPVRLIALSEREAMSYEWNPSITEQSQYSEPNSPKSRTHLYHPLVKPT